MSDERSIVPGRRQLGIDLGQLGGQRGEVLAGFDSLEHRFCLGACDLFEGTAHVDRARISAGLIGPRNGAIECPIDLEDARPRTPSHQPPHRSLVEPRPGDRQCGEGHDVEQHEIVGLGLDFAQCCTPAIDSFDLVAPAE